MSYVDSQGNYYTGERAPRGIEVFVKPSSNHKLKTNWQTLIPDVWELDLTSKRNEKTANIDATTNDLIAAGFQFQGKTFSLSIEAQAKLMIINNLAVANLLDPATPLSTLDNQLFELQRADAPAFVAAAYARLSSVLIMGSVLKGQVMSANDETSIDSIQDTRQ